MRLRLLMAINRKSYKGFQLHGGRIQVRQGNIMKNNASARTYKILRVMRIVKMIMR